MGKKKFVFLAVSLVLLLIVSAVLYKQLGGNVDADQLGTQDPQGQEQQDAGQQEPQKALAPDFTVVDADGREVKLSDFRGKPTVVNFWATWCGYCKQEMPDFEEVYLEMGDEVNFLMVNMTDGSRETVEMASTYIADSGYTFPVYYDTQMEAMFVRLWRLFPAGHLFLRCGGIWHRTGYRCAGQRYTAAGNCYDHRIKRKRNKSASFLFNVVPAYQALCFIVDICCHRDHICIPSGFHLQ